MMEQRRLIARYEEECAECNGTGGAYHDLIHGWTSCGECSGSGVVLTEEGNDLASFINRILDARAKREA